jgi:hypothetical protein
MLLLAKPHLILTSGRADRVYLYKEFFNNPNFKSIKDKFIPFAVLSEKYNDYFWTKKVSTVTSITEKSSNQKCRRKFYYQNGQILNYDQVTSNHVKSIAKVLASIHQIHAKPFDQKTSFYYQEFLNINHPLAFKSQALKDKIIVSHRDLTLNNVIWNDENPHLIDWEMAGGIHRTKDAIATGLNWCLSKHYKVNENLLVDFLSQYTCLYKKLLLSDLKNSLEEIIKDWNDWIRWNHHLWSIKKLHSLQLEILNTRIAVKQIKSQSSYITRILSHFAK